jgi:hypothetical protein
MALSFISSSDVLGSAACGAESTSVSRWFFMRISMASCHTAYYSGKQCHISMVLGTISLASEPGSMVSEAESTGVS